MSENQKYFLVFFVIIPIFFIAAFYFISGSFFDVPHYNVLATQWCDYIPNRNTPPLEKEAEETIALLNQHSLKDKGINKK